MSHGGWKSHSLHLAELVRLQIVLSDMQQQSRCSFALANEANKAFMTDRPLAFYHAIIRPLPAEQNL